MSDGRSHAGSVSPCCYQRAATKGAMFCGECRSPILRCMAYEECGGLLGPDSRCPVCVSPHLFLDAGARRDVKAGGALVLPLMLGNSSPVRRPLFVTGVWVREGGGDLRRQDVGWERLEAGVSNPLWVQTGALERQGRSLFEISFAVATSYRWREESFAFRSNLELDIEQGGSVVINQTINAGGQESGFGGARERANPDRGWVWRRRSTGSAHRSRTTQSHCARTFSNARMAFVAIRSGPLKGSAVLRSAQIAWKGFPKGDAPPARPITTEDALDRGGSLQYKRQWRRRRCPSSRPKRAGPAR